MKRIADYGEIFQLAYVVGDLNAALRHWTQVIGAGPFFLRPGIVLAGWKYKAKVVDINIDVAMGYWGDTQVELIHQNCQTPSVYLEWQAQRREGIHHFGILCSDGARARQALSASGFTVEQEVDGPTGGMF